MHNLWLKIRIWTKIVIFTLLAIYLIAFIASNWGQEVKLWLFFFTTQPTLPLLVVIFLTLCIGVVGTLLARLVLGTIGQIRDMRQRSRQEQLQRDVEEMKSKAAMLQTQGEKPAEKAAEKTGL